MIRTTPGFVLREIKYGDTKSIVKVYTQDKGLCSFMVSGLRSSKSKAGKAGLFPLSEMEFTYVEHNENAELHNVRQYKPIVAYQSLYGDISKSSMLIFLSEVLSKSLPQGQADESLYSYIKTFLEKLDTVQTQYAHYHLEFLVNLMRFIGCYPKVGKYKECKDFVFDLRGGEFCSYASHSEVIDKRGGVEVLHWILEAPGQERLKSLSAGERNCVLQNLLQYYKIQLSVSEIKSYQVLKEVFRT